MKVSIDNTYKLLINLIDWSKSQTGMIVLNPIQINLYEFINSSIQLLSLSAEAKSIKIKVHIDTKKYVIADCDLLTTIFSNLISNAIKFTPNGGEIEIGVIESYEDLQTIIYVKDNGIGIDSKIIPNLFRIDKKISYLGTNHETGSGLGLILCKEFIEKHGGKIWLESEVNKGSTFYFTLPN